MSRAVGRHAALFALAALVATPLFARTHASHVPPAAPAAPKGDAVRGEHLYQSCMGCHSLDDNDVGPRHRGVVGRAAGSVPDYAYSPALKASHIIWTPANLDRWLTGPRAMVPGTRMVYSVPAPQDRADIIAYLATRK